MAFSLVCGFILTLSAVLCIQADISVDCGKSSVSVRWTAQQLLADPQFLRLGDCPPSSVSVRPAGTEALFHVKFDDCNFRRLVTEDEVVFENELKSGASSPKASSFSSPVVCVYKKPANWRPPQYGPVFFHTTGRGDLVFYMSFMKEDFSGVATSSTFSLGSLIPVAAAVEQKAHQPLVLLLEECIASTTPELSPDSHVYPIITNKGCLVDSRKTNSRFLPRQRPSEIKLQLQAFKFAFAENVYIHCKLVAWDPKEMDSGKKACQYDKRNRRWELLDKSMESDLCDCCETHCQARKKRGTRMALVHPVVLGPLIITD